MTNPDSLTRRTLLKTLPLAPAAITAAWSFEAIARPEKRPAPEDLTRYYAFLWLEFQRLSIEMNIDMHDLWTATRNGDMRALKRHLTSPPSSRALTILTAIGADRASMISAL